jgi:hypothetical protein
VHGQVHRRHGGVQGGLECTSRYMYVIEGFRVGLECTSRYMDVMEGFRVGLECTSRYMAVSARPFCTRYINKKSM